MSGVELTGPSLWADWRRRNTDVTIPLGIAALEQAGNLANLRRLIDAAPNPHVGFPFSDTDVYKTLEAIAWAGQSATPGLLGEFFANTVALLEKVQAPNGMLNSYIQRNPTTRAVRRPRGIARAVHGRPSHPGCRGRSPDDG